MGGAAVPQIVIGGTHGGGFDDLYALEHSGVLDGVLALEGITSRGKAPS